MGNPVLLSEPWEVSAQESGCNVLSEIETKVKQKLTSLYKQRARTIIFVKLAGNKQDATFWIFISDTMFPNKLTNWNTTALE